MNALQDHVNIYESLQFAGDRPQIRLLRLLDYDKNAVQAKPLEDAEPLNFELAVYDCDAAPAYDAISYAWGEAKPTWAVFVNSTQLEVGENCHYAFRQARLQDAEYIWLDAICINQQDLAEKGQQVAMMYSVFSTARRVLACIGPADDASDLILQSSQDFRSYGAHNRPHKESSRSLRASLDGYSGPGLWGNWHPSRRRNSVDYSKLVRILPDGPWKPKKRRTWFRGHAGFGAQFCKAVIALFQRAYFQRLWIGQEIHGGGVDCLFLVGTSSFWLLNLKYMYQAAICINTHDPRSDKPVSLLLEMLLAPAKERSIMEYTMPHLRLAKHLLCSDPRDRVYGTMGFYEYKRFGEPMVPDYHKSAFDLALDLSKLNNNSLDLHGLQHCVEALEIGFCHTQLAPYFEGCRVACRASSTEVRAWGALFVGRRVIDGFESLELQDVIKKQESIGSDLSGEKHNSCEGSKSNDCQGFAIQCDRLLQEQWVIKGVAGLEDLRDEWLVPATARVGDGILSAVKSSVHVDGAPPDDFLEILDDLALVVRIDPAAETFTVVGFATHIPDSEGGSISETTLRQWRELSPWQNFFVDFKATTEEMMPLAIPQHQGLLHARHAFRLPKCGSVMDASTMACWSKTDRHGVLERKYERFF